MNNLKLLSRLSQREAHLRVQNIQTSPLQNLKKDTLARIWRLKMYRSKLMSGEGRLGYGRRKWSKRFVLLGSATVGLGAFGGAVLSDSSIGPIYKFENNEDYDLPLDYNIAAMENFFNKRPFEVIMRTGEILSEIIPYFSKVFIWEYYIRRKIRDHEGLQKKYAVELREMLTRLGPSFIKFGQAMSIRPDLLPSSFLFELQKLCDAVPSYPTKEAIEVIESELGVTINTVFAGIDEKTDPIAAASLGQVYKVNLVSEDKVVAVKVQRPDMHHYVLRDIYILRLVARTTQWIKSNLTYQRPFDVALLDTFANATIKELDYLNEAANQIKCKETLEPRQKDKIYIPKVYEKHTTRKVRKKKLY